jgi:hypothetical protein
VTKQLECRIVITHEPVISLSIYAGPSKTFSLGMYDVLNERYVPLGKHDSRQIDKIVGDLRVSIERAGHRVTFSEVTAPR